MEPQDQERIDRNLHQLKMLWLGFATSPPFSALVLLLVLPAGPAGGMPLFTAVGLLTSLLCVPMAARFRRALYAYCSGRVVEPVALQRALIFGAMTAEIPMLIGIAQYALRPNTPALLLLCAASFALSLMFLPRKR